MWIIGRALQIIGGLFVVMFAIFLLNGAPSATAPAGQPAAPAPVKPAPQPAVERSEAPQASSEASSAVMYLVGARPGGSVVIWRDSQAMGEGIVIVDLQGGATDKNLVKLAARTACLADYGSAAVVTSVGPFASEVVVMSGRQQGCHGVVVNTALQDHV